MKGLGVCLILASGFCCGLNALRLRGQRMDMLRTLCDMLSRMEAELGSRSPSTPELFLRLLPSSKGAAALFCETVGKRLPFLGTMSFEQIWTAAARETLPLLTREEQTEFFRLGAVIGRYAVSDQVAALRCCRQLLQAGLDQARAEYPAERKLALALSLSGALFLVIVLL